MDIDKVGYGSVPNEINVVIEIGAYSEPVKYEFDKDINGLKVDRFLSASMQYPGNYGFVPNTIAEDGDPIDVIVCSRFPLVPACVISARPVGVLIMRDEAGEDPKVIMVPSSSVDPFYDGVQDYNDLPEIFRASIMHFFTYYKKLDKNKESIVDGWKDREHAISLIKESIQRAQ